MPHDNIDTFQDMVSSQLLSFRHNPGYKKGHHLQYNLTIAQREAIKTLANDDTIVIRPADKGGNVVLLDKDKYIREATCQLDNPMFYPKTNKNDYRNSVTGIWSLLVDWKDKGLL